MIINHKMDDYLNKYRIRSQEVAGKMQLVARKTRCFALLNCLGAKENFPGESELLFQRQPTR
jgi:hypothetical protein